MAGYKQMGIDAEHLMRNPHLITLIPSHPTHPTFPLTPDQLITSRANGSNDWPMPSYSYIWELLYDMYGSQYIIIGQWGTASCKSRNVYFGVGFIKPTHLQDTLFPLSSSF